MVSSQSSIFVTNSTGNKSNFFTLISWKDDYARQGGSLEGSLRSEIDNINKITLEVRESAVVGFI